MTVEIIDIEPEPLPVPAVSPAGTLARLDEPTRTGHTVTQLMAAWIGERCKTADTEDAYRRGLNTFIQWCTDHELDVLTIKQPEAGMYAHFLRTAIVKRTGRPYSPKSQDRNLAIVSSFYRYLYRVGAVDANPFADVQRPNAKTPARPTESLVERQATAVLATSKSITHRGLGPYLPAVIVHLMIGLGIRVSEVCKANRDSLGYHNGMRTLTVYAKGGKVLVRPIPVQIAPLIDAYRVHRPEPADDDARRALFLDAKGKRVTRWQVRQMLARVAREAGVPNFERITPHSSRHTFNTVAKERGATLEDRRDALGHSSASVTQLYDHAPLSLERDPAHLVAASLFTAPR
jgi:site-specific recombinase XerD